MDLADQLPQLLSALFMVLLLMGALAWLARRLRLPSMKSDAASALRMHSTLNLGQREKLVVVQFGEQQLLLGITATRISTLATAESPGSSAPGATNTGAAPADVSPTQGHDGSVLSAPSRAPLS